MEGIVPETKLNGLVDNTETPGESKLEKTNM